MSSSFTCSFPAYSRPGQVLLDLAGVIFQEQSTLELMIHRILTHMMCLIQVTVTVTVTVTVIVTVTVTVTVNVTVNVNFIITINVTVTVTISVTTKTFLTVLLQCERAMVLLVHEGSQSTFSR